MSIVALPHSDGTRGHHQNAYNKVVQEIQRDQTKNLMQTQLRDAPLQHIDGSLS